MKRDISKQMNNSMSLPILQHFTHPHLLRKEASHQNLGEGYLNGEFVCDACNNLGCGIRYHCSQCKFDLHEECAACPKYLNSYLHPNHQLILVWEGSSLRSQLRLCNICGDQVNGLFYKCSSGERCCFFIHPLCSQIQSQVRHVTDKRHLLTFQSVPIKPDSACTVCGGLVCSSSWTYRCDPCGINIHLECITSENFRDPQHHVHQERRPAHPHAPQAQNHNYPPAPPYGYPPMEMPLPHYHNYYPPVPPHGGGNRRRMYAIVGRIAMSMIVSATVGVPLVD